MRFSLINPATYAEGPGLRFAVWVQGCPLRCSGCFNPHMFDPLLGLEVSIQDLINQFQQQMDEYPNLEGITFLGGEPFAQAKELAILARYVKKAGKSVLTFSGFSYNHLKKGKIPNSIALLNETDVLVAGPFLEKKIDLSRSLLGSTNQEYVFLTDTYTLSDFEGPDQVEFVIQRTGKITMNGWATDSTLKILSRNLTPPPR